MKEGKIQTHNQYVSRDEGLHEDTYTLRHFNVLETAGLVNSFFLTDCWFSYLWKCC